MIELHQNITATLDKSTTGVTVGVTVPLWNANRGGVARALATQSLVSADAERLRVDLLAEFEFRFSAFEVAAGQVRTQPVVVDVLPLNGHSGQELLARAAALESRSDHPLARAVLECARERGVEALRVSDFRIVPGKGALGTVEGQEYWLGSHRYPEERGQETPEVHEELERLSATGRSVIIVGNADHVCGMLATADDLRPEAAATVAALKRAGISWVVMLTGDNRATAEITLDNHARPPHCLPGS